MITVLIVEDNDKKYDVIIEKLTNLNINKNSISRTDNIFDTELALERSHFDILILDMQLPKRSKGNKSNDAGLSLLKSIKHDVKKKKPKYKTPPVIIGLTEHVDIFNEQAKHFTQQRVFSYKYDSLSDDWAVNLSDTIEEYIGTKEVMVEKVDKTKIIYSIHGIMSYGNWQDDFDKYLISECDNENIKHIKFKYNFVPFISFLVPSLRKREVKVFINEMLDLQNKYPNSEVNVIAHSFGTYVLAKALDELTLVSSPKFNRIILCGSVLKPGFSWTNIINKYSLKGVLNECAVSDYPLIMSHSIAVGLGMAGRVGFKNTNVGDVTNRFKVGGHGSFFTSDIFNDWTSFFVNGKVKESYVRKDPNILSSIINMLILYSPKIIICIIILLAFKFI